MTDLARVQDAGSLATDMEYARVVAVGDLLPPAYRGKPANVLLAMGLGKAMGLSPAEALYRIHVIQGRPTAAAELIASNVRKAGHRLRVSGDETQARATIIRSDDPEFEFESVWTLDRARRLDLANKDGWKKQPGTMMRWRAVTEVARLACPEALYGVAYVADEVGEFVQSAPAPRATADMFAAPAEGDVQDAEVVASDAETAEPITAAQLKALHTLLGKADMDRDAAIAWFCQRTDRDITSSKDLTKREASDLIDALSAAMTDTDALPVGGESNG